MEEDGEGGARCALCEIARAVGWGLAAGVVAGVVYMAVDLLLDGKLTAAWSAPASLAPVTDITRGSSESA